MFPVRLLTRISHNHYMVTGFFFVKPVSVWSTSIKTIDNGIILNITSKPLFSIYIKYIWMKCYDTKLESQYNFVSKLQMDLTEVNWTDISIEIKNIFISHFSFFLRGVFRGLVIGGYIQVIDLLEISLYSLCINLWIIWIYISLQKKKKVCHMQI